MSSSCYLACVFVHGYLEKLLEDKTGDIWADLSPLSFDKWKADAMIKMGKHVNTTARRAMR